MQAPLCLPGNLAVCVDMVHDTHVITTAVEDSRHARRIRPLVLGMPVAAAPAKIGSDRQATLPPVSLRPASPPATPIYGWGFISPAMRASEKEVNIGHAWFLNYRFYGNRPYGYMYKETRTTQLMKELTRRESVERTVGCSLRVRGHIIGHARNNM